MILFYNKSITLASLLYVAILSFSEIKAQEIVSDPVTEEEYSSLPPIGSVDSDFSYKTYSLSYMQSDKVLALLKALGYSTIEFDASQGESLTESIYTIVQDSQNFPLIIKIIDANKTSLFQPSKDGGNGSESENTLGGTYLHEQTSGAPEQRLFIVYDKNSPGSLNSLLELLRNEIDIPAKQVVIEALVVEVDSEELNELGVKYDIVRSEFGATADWSSTQSNTPFTITDNGVFDNEGYQKPLGFNAFIQALINSKKAEILSNPSVLVLNGRQARIQIGRQEPVSQTAGTVSVVRSGIRYIQTGIVLNIRPRLNEDGSEVTMQVETIISSKEADSNLKNKDILAPIIYNRQVQSFVRVADNTPFIVGGLIQSDNIETESGLPGLSKIPYLGNLFKNSKKSKVKKEVIVVLTPHVIDTGEKSFSYVIPKDSKTFDSFDNILFRNAYRIRDDDVFDLSFATQSNYYIQILDELRAFKENHPKVSDTEPIYGYLKDKVPGEEVIVRRMIWEIIHKSKFHTNISNDHILIFESNEEVEYGNKFKTLFLHNLLSTLNQSDENALILDYADHKSKPSGPFEHPRALISRSTIKNPENYVEQISVLNSDDLNRNTILLSPSVPPPGVRGATALDVLKGVLVLKRILALNPSMPVTIREFRVGRQITFPTEQELQDKYHIVDYDTARFFYQIINYYPEFEDAFNRDSKAILNRMKQFDGDTSP